MYDKKSESTPRRDATEEEYKRQFLAGNKLSFAQAFWTTPDSRHATNMDSPQQRQSTQTPLSSA